MSSSCAEDEARRKVRCLLSFSSGIDRSLEIIKQTLAQLTPHILPLSEESEQ
jgi:hypothetical protein